MATSNVWVNLIANSWKASSIIYWLSFSILYATRTRSWSPDKSCFKPTKHQKNTLAQSTALRHRVCVVPFGIGLFETGLCAFGVCVCKRGGPIVWRGGKPLQAMRDKGAGTVLLLAGRDIYTAPTIRLFIRWIPCYLASVSRGSQASGAIHPAHTRQSPSFQLNFLWIIDKKKQVPVLSLYSLYYKGCSSYISTGLCSRCFSSFSRPWAPERNSRESLCCVRIQ